MNLYMTYIHECQHHGGARGKVKGSGFSTWEPYMSVSNLVFIYSKEVEMFR